MIKRIFCWLFHKRFRICFGREYTPNFYHYREFWSCIKCDYDWEEYDDVDIMLL